VLTEGTFGQERPEERLPSLNWWEAT
jgi:hypothetical protein